MIAAHTPDEKNSNRNSDPIENVDCLLDEAFQVKTVSILSKKEAQSKELEADLHSFCEGKKEG